MDRSHETTIEEKIMETIILISMHIIAVVACFYIGYKTGLTTRKKSTNI